MRRLALLVPLALVLALVGLFYVRLYAGDPSQLPSALIGRQAPDFTLPPLEGLTHADGTQVPGLSRADLQSGHVTVVNVWASWCVPCRAEHPLLQKLADIKRVRLVGIGYKDDADNALSFLKELGNPFEAVGMDQRGRAAIDWGVYGVPETFIVDRSGRITYKHIGPITEQSLADIILPEIGKAEHGSVSAAR